MGVTGYTLFQLKKFKEAADSISKDQMKRLAYLIRARNIEKSRKFEQFLEDLL